jgi:hypothetical protein
LINTIWNYSISFFQIVVVNCVTVPANWEHCYRIDKWLIPDIIYAWELKTGKIYPYQQEKEYLEGQPDW